MVGENITNTPAFELFERKRERFYHVRQGYYKDIHVVRGSAILSWEKDAGKNLQHPR